MVATRDAGRCSSTLHSTNLSAPTISDLLGNGIAGVLAVSPRFDLSVEVQRRHITSFVLNLVRRSTQNLAEFERLLLHHCNPSVPLLLLLQQNVLHFCGHVVQLLRQYTQLLLFFAELLLEVLTLHKLRPCFTELLFEVLTFHQLGLCFAELFFEVLTLKLAPLVVAMGGSGEREQRNVEQEIDHCVVESGAGG